MPAALHDPIAPATGCDSADPVHDAARRLDTVGLDELDHVELFDRVDTKVLIPRRAVAEVLERIGAHYAVLDIDGTVVHDYDSLYLDTPGLDLYTWHHNGVRPRYKLRYRNYRGTGLWVFESKLKTNSGRTLKDRIAVGEPSGALSLPERALVEASTPIDPDRLVTAARTTFRRLTLLRLDGLERATVDVDVTLGSGLRHRPCTDAAICEVKQPGFDRSSPLLDALRPHARRTTGLSKYCLAVAFNRRVKANNFHVTMREFDRLGSAVMPRVSAESFLGAEVLDRDQSLSLLVRFAFDLLATTTIVFGAYYRRLRHPDHVVTFYVFNVTVLVVVFVMSGIELSIGFGFGLFGLFTILRFRTVTIPQFEMTFAFAVIAVGVVNGLRVEELTLAEVALANLLIVATILVLFRFWHPVQAATQVVRYERIANIRPDQHDELVADLRERTGLDVVDVEVEEIDFVNDTAMVRITHQPHRTPAGRPARR